jgi:hypothetical protein
MDMKQLEALGITAEDLTQRIVDHAVDSLLHSILRNGNFFNAGDKRCEASD